MFSVRFALSTEVPTPWPAAADARTAAVVPRPGVAGLTVPARAASVSWVSVGTHPSWSPEMSPCGLEVVFRKWAACPLTDQPGKVFRVSETVIGKSWPVAEVPAPFTVRLTVPAPTVRVKTPDVGTVTASGSKKPPAGMTDTGIAEEVDPDTCTPAAGANAAVTETVPDVENVVVVVAMPPAPTVTGDPMADPPVENVTVPFGVELSLMVTVAVRVTVWPVWAGFGDTCSVVVLLGCDGAVALVE